MASAPGLIPGANVSGSSNLTLPFQSAQQGGQAAMGGAINPLLPINTSTSTAYPMMPQGAVSTSATAGFPAMTNTGGFPANQGGATSGPVTGAPGAGGTGTLGTGSGSAPSGLPGSGFGGLTGQQQDKLLKNLDNTYGKGMGALMLSFLSGGAGYNTQAINNMIAQLQPTFNQQQQNLLQQFSAGGNRFSSGGQVGFADLLSQQGLEVGSIETQMYESAINDYLSVLMGTGGASASRIQDQSSFMDTLTGSGGLTGLLSTIHGMIPPATPA